MGDRDRARPGADRVRGGSRAILADQIRRLSIEAIPITHAHAWEVATLPAVHRDPFDRLLVAQARVEAATILTADPEISRYGVPTIW